MATLQTTQQIFPVENEIPQKHQLHSFLEKNEYLIEGKIRYWDGEMNDILSPICIQNENGKLTRKVIGRTPMLTSNQALEALQAATNAFNSGRGKWVKMSVNQRISHVENFIERMRLKRNNIVNLLMWEIGKSLKDSEKEFDRTIDYLMDTIDATKDMDRTASKFEITQGIIGQVRRVPLGVALCMGPYNYPLNETFTTLFPALLMGNTVVFKPAKYGVLLIQPLLEAFRDCFPKGVINVIFGSGRTLAGTIMLTGKVNVFAFIGTNKGANDLKKMHPKPHALKAILGLDAKNPAIILPDADLDVVVKECIMGSLSFNGQRCTALKIIFVHKSIADAFNQKFCAAVNQLKVGMPWDDGVNITPLPELGKSDYLKALVDDALINGATVLNQNGGTIKETLYFPAVVYPVNKKMRLYAEEQFGPVVPIIPYENLDTPINYIVESNYGQQASIFGKSPERIAKVIDALVNQVSRININAQCQRGPDNFPFNGRKDSAEGTLSVRDALRVFSIRTTVATKYDETNKEIFDEILKSNYSDFLRTDYIL